MQTHLFDRLQQAVPALLRRSSIRRLASRDSVIPAHASSCTSDNAPKLHEIDKSVHGVMEEEENTQVRMYWCVIAAFVFVFVVYVERARSLVRV